MPSAAFPVVEGPMTASCRGEAGAAVTDSGDDAAPESVSTPLASTQVRTRNFVKSMATVTVLPAGRARVRVLTGQGGGGYRPAVLAEPCRPRLADSQLIRGSNDLLRRPPRSQGRARSRSPTGGGMRSREDVYFRYFESRTIFQWAPRRGTGAPYADGKPIHARETRTRSRDRHMDGRPGHPQRSREVDREGSRGRRAGRR